MQEILIKKVESKSDLNTFIKCQWNFYKNDPYWVPPLIMERKTILSKEKNPFFQNAQAEYFLAIKDGLIVGRIAAIKNDMHLKYHNDNSGFFGFFECINCLLYTSDAADERSSVDLGGRRIIKKKKTTKKKRRRGM